MSDGLALCITDLAVLTGSFLFAHWHGRRLAVLIISIASWFKIILRQVEFGLSVRPAFGGFRNFRALWPLARTWVGVVRASGFAQTPSRVRVPLSTHALQDLDVG